MGELFEIKGNPQLNKDSFTFSENGKYPYFTRTVFINGIAGYVDYLNEENKIAGNCLAVGMIGMQFFYMENDFYAGQFTKRAIPKSFLLTQRIAHYFITLLNKNQLVYQNVLVRDFEQVFNNTKIQLPIKHGEIDFTIMEEFIAELEAQRIAELEAYLSAAGLKNFELTLEEEQVLSNFAMMEFESFKVVDVFQVKNSGNILSRDIVENSGQTPYLCASSENNAVSSYISFNEALIDKGNCVFIGGKTFVVSYQEKDFYSNDSHNLILYLRNENQRNKLNHLFLATCVDKGLGHKYSWGNSISNKKIQTDVFMLPTQNHEPNFAFMQTFISAVQKLVIKDVVHYADKKIAATNQVVQRH